MTTRTWSFTSTDDRLIAVRGERVSFGSGVGRKGDSRGIVTIAVR